MPEAQNLPQTRTNARASFETFLLWKLIGILFGGVAGAILEGNAIVWLRDPAKIWTAAFPPEGIIGAVGGVLLGGTLAGGRIGLFGKSLLIGTAGGLLLCPGLFFLGAIAGLLTGFIVGLILEIIFSRSPASK